MRDAPFNAVQRDDLDPICPHCGEVLTEVYYKGQGASWFLFPRNSIFFCPHCHKVLGLGQSRMA